MAELTPEEHRIVLDQLAQRIHSWHLGGVAQLLLNLGQGANIVASHLLFFVQPLAPTASWRQSLHRYASALEDDKSWQALTEHLKALES